MRIAIPLALLATTLSCALFAAPAQAQRDRVFVASYGSDSNPCTFGSPCKTFQNAYNVVAVGGEVTAIDSAGFGPISIGHSVTITSPDGVEAGIAAASGADAIDINAGPTDVVVLHGLTLDGVEAANNGINLQSGGSLTVENCIVRNMQVAGIYYVSSASTSQKLVVSNSSFINNGTFYGGIYIESSASSSGSITASIDHTGLYDGQSGAAGLWVDGRGTGAVNVAVTDSVAANNPYGFYIDQQTTGGVATLSLSYVLAEGNEIAFETFSSNGSAEIWLADSTATGNSSVWYADPTETILSYGDNYLSAGNGTNTNSLGTATKQ
jgi:hypothetical protein